MKTGALVVAGVALVLCACGSKEKQERESAGASASQAAGQVRAGDNAVAAVLESQGTLVAGLWFEVGERPVVGQPFALKLLASAPQPVPALRLSIDSQGLIVIPESGVVELAAANTPVAHELTLTAREPGLVDLRVRLSAEEGSAATVYAIPVLVAEAN